MGGKTLSAFSVASLMFLAVFGFPSIAKSEIVQEWQVIPATNGAVSEASGILSMSGGNGHDIPPYMYRDYKPASDFEVSFDLKAETLGEVLLDQAGEGFVFSFANIDITSSQDHVFSFWCRARAGGQFLLAWHDALCDQYGWDCNWEPFVYNGIGYNNGYDFWHPNPPLDRSNAPIQPNTWYTIKLKVLKFPFTVIGEAYNETGYLMGSLTIQTINNHTFEDINHLYMSTGAGGTFYIRNLIIRNVQPADLECITISTQPNVTLGSPLDIWGNLEKRGVALTNELVLLKYSFAGADEWCPITSVYTDNDGSYRAQWICPATGTFTLSAEWKANGTHPSASVNATVICLPIQSESSIFNAAKSTSASSGEGNTTLFSKADISVWTWLFVASVPLGGCGSMFVYFKRRKH